MAFFICYKTRMKGTNINMIQGQLTLIKASIYQNKCLINKNNFVRGGACLAFHRRAHSDRLDTKFKTLPDVHGGHRGVFLCLQKGRIKDE